MSAPPPLLARFGEYQLDEADARLSRAGAPVELQPRAFAVLCTLLRTPGQLVLKEALLDAVWGHRHVSESVLKSTVSQLRSALADDAKQPRYIETASRRGYRFIAALGAPAGPMPAAPLPLPPSAAAPAAAPTADLIARAEPLRRLQAAHAASLQGRRQLMLLGGEAGIGKSTLIDRFLATLPPQPGAQALGQCVEHYGAAEPYMPVLEALNLLCRGAEGAARLALLRSVAPTWLVQLPWYLAEADRAALQREAAGATQDRMLREFGEWIDRCTALESLVLVLEDLHWSDHATVQWLGYLARRRAPARLLVLASFRPAEVIAVGHPLAGLRQELRLHRLCEEIDLEAFSEAEIGTLLAGRLGGEAPEDFVRALHAHTEGLPLFLVNVIDELIERGALQRDAAGRWRLPEPGALALPQHLVGVVEKQIERLPADLQRLLGAASVAGVEFLHLPLATLLDVPPEAVQRSLETPLLRQHWLRSTGVLALPDGRIAARHAFRHALYRQVFYQRADAAQRLQWHRGWAAALRALHGDRAAEVAGELALHLERGGDAPAAAAQFARVAARALSRSAAAEALQAARHGQQLLGQPPAVPRLALELRLLEGAALTRLHLFSAPEVEAAFERACALGEQVDDNALRARALHGLWWVRHARADLVPARALSERLLALAQGSAGDARLRLAGHATLGITLLMMGEMSTARGHLETALALCADVRDELPPGLFVQHPGVEARIYLALASWWTGSPGQARRLAEEAVELARAIRHPISQVIAWHIRGVLHYFAGDYRQAREATAAVAEVIERQGLPRRPGAFAWLHGHVVAALGEVEAGLAAMRAAERSCRELGMRIGLTGFYLHYAEACLEAGRSEEGLAMALQGAALAEAGPERFMHAPLLRVRAGLLHRLDRPGEAVLALQQSIAVARGQGALFHELRALVDLLELAPEPALHERLRTLLPGFAGEALPVLERAQVLLAGQRTV